MISCHSSGGMVDVVYPKAPWDVMGCQVATCFKAPGVSLGGSGVSIGGVRSLRVGKIFQFGCCLLLRGRGSHGSHGYRQRSWSI